MSQQRQIHVAGINWLWNLSKILNEVKGHNKGAQPQSPEPFPSFMGQRRGEIVTVASSNVPFICLSKYRHYQPFLPHFKWQIEALLMQFGNWREIWGMERSRCQVFMRASFIPSKLQATTQEVGDLGSQAGRSPMAENSSPKKSPLKTILWCGIWLKPTTLATNRGKKIPWGWTQTERKHRMSGFVSEKGKIHKL